MPPPNFSLPGQKFRARFFVCSNYISNVKLLTCPSVSSKVTGYGDWAGFDAGVDKDGNVLADNKPLSYFLCMQVEEKYPQLLFAGDKNLRWWNGTKVKGGESGDITFVYAGGAAGAGADYTTATWGPDNLHRRSGNVLVADGHTAVTTDASIRKLLQQGLDALGGVNSKNALIFKNSPD